MCKTKGGRLCKVEEVQKAQTKDAEWCNWGWCEDLDPKDQKRAAIAFPMKSKDAGCGDKGLNMTFVSKSLQYGANCCMP